MMMILFDTLATARKIEDAGFSRQQAEGMSNALRDALDMAIGNLATKEDLSRMQATTQSDIAHLATVTKSDIARLETSTKSDIDRIVAAQRALIAEATNRQIVWTVGTVVAMAGIALAIARLA